MKSITIIIQAMGTQEHDAFASPQTFCLARARKYQKLAVYTLGS
jgi:hypothetical protein